MRLLTGGVNSLLKRAEKTDARLDAVYDQGTNLANALQAEATKNESRHAETAGRIGDLRRTVIQARIEDNKLRREEETRRDELRRKEETRRDELRREEETRRDEQQLADLEADEREKEAECIREREQQQYLMKGLEAAVGASRAAADTAKENKAMLTVALEQRTPVKGTPVKGPVRGRQGTPGASVRGQGTPTPSLEVGGQQPLELQTLNGLELHPRSPLTEQPTEQPTELHGYSYSFVGGVESYSFCAPAGEPAGEPPHLLASPAYPLPLETPPSP